MSLKFTEHTINDVKLRVVHENFGEDNSDQLFEDFFDPEFNIAVATGYTKTWEGSFLLLDYIRSGECPILIEGLNIIEMGSGCGMFGMCLSVLKNNVLLSDVACVCTKVISVNLKGNSTEEVNNFFIPNISGSRIGSGSVAVMPIDWAHPLPTNLDCSKCDLIIAAECVWIPTLLEPFSTCFARLLNACKPGTRGLMCYPVRGTDTSYFTSRKQFEQSMATAGLELSEIKVFGQQENDPDVKETIIYIVTLPSTILKE